MKRALAIMLAVVCAFCACASIGCAKYTHIVITTQRLGDFYCSMYEDETVEIIKYMGDDRIVQVPSGINGRTVVGISTRAFVDEENVEEVYLPASITELPAKLFDNCAALRAVYIPATVTKIGKYFITDCPEFTTIRFGGNVTQWNKISKGSVLTENYALSAAEFEFEYVVGN